MEPSGNGPEHADELCRELLGEIDEMAAKTAKLTDAQRADIDRWRGEIRELCRQGKLDEAKRATRLAVALAWEGAPSKE